MTESAAERTLPPPPLHLTRSAEQPPGEDRRIGSGTARGGMKGVKFHPLSYPGCPFSIVVLLTTATFHCQLSMKMLNLHVLEGSYRVLNGQFQASGSPSYVQEGGLKGREGPFENKVGEKLIVFIFGRGPTRSGGPSTANFIPVPRALAAPLRIGGYKSSLTTAI